MTGLGQTNTRSLTDMPYNTNPPAAIHKSGIAIALQKTTMQTQASLSLPPGLGNYPQFVTHRAWHSDFRHLETYGRWSRPLLPGDERFYNAGLDVSYIYVVIPEAEWRERQGSLVAPAWLSFSQSKGAALMFKWGEINPLTLASEMSLSLAPQPCTISGMTQMVQSIIDTGKSPWLDGFPTNPFRMHDHDALVRQMLFTFNRNLDMSMFVTGNGPTPWTISVLAWEQEYVEPPMVMRGAHAKGLRSLEAASITAGETMRQPIPRARPASAFKDQPCAMARYFVVDEMTAQRLGLYPQTTSYPQRPEPQKDWMTSSGAPVVHTPGLKF